MTEARSTAGIATTVLDSRRDPAESNEHTLDLELPYANEARSPLGQPPMDASTDAELARWNAGGSAEPSALGAQPSFHPGTRVVVDTRLAKRRAGAPASAALRGLTLDRIQAQTRSRGYWPFRTCFEKGQREHPGSGGETRIAFTIGTRGTVRAARLLDSGLKNSASQACLVRELLRLQFNPPPSRVLAMVATVALWPGDLPVSALPSAGESAAEVVTSGDFDPLAARARLTTLMPQLRECFAVARQRDPSLWGRLALAVTLEMDGSVHRVVETESRFPNANVTRCVEALIASLIFPSVNGKPFTFVAPLRLAPDAAANAASSADAPSSQGDPQLRKAD